MDLDNNFFAGADVLITGGLGFIGSNLAHALVKLGARVMVIDKLHEDQGGNLFNVSEIKDRIRVVIADLSEKEIVEESVKSQDVIFNLAGQTSHPDSMRFPTQDIHCNFLSHAALLEACRKCNDKARIVLASTRQVYGKPKYLPVDERHPTEPMDVNGISKLACEQLHSLYNKVYGMKTCSLRLTNTFGPRQLMKHNRQGFIPWFIRQALDGEKIKIFGTGEQRRDINYITDVVDAFLLAAGNENSNNKIYNLGGEIISLLDFTKLLIDVAGSGSFEIVPFPEERAKIDIGNVYSDYSEIKEELGWEPRVSIEQGLRETIAYYRQHKSNYW